ncbi:uncharacterized protein BP01DRAFT_390441 [Aspergillus saccharolyticus JOP 1030-1]|uniref:Uncharacterized protein n=1 Tax=Aspergillus saccharolyticus JOP 1030-1 TaxID=1450539 RepID=A0A318ZK63_9EURO|nr:hypothetical protein BP01DRAFT_390441 [Aspergillus saccharolyticus JOP 1030-1]PYH46764.1 hypothetical protein BP01DRAFT_390441 [Aspergillus saccharolyticus JOP 1030-1]
MAVPDGVGANLPAYRPAKPLPFELVQHSGIFLEEKLYTQALNLLLEVLTAGTIASTPAFVPPPQHLAVAATFLVHPTTTTRAKTAEGEEAPNAALRLLRLTNALVGPIAAKFGLAFSFTHFATSRHGRRRRGADDTPTSEAAEDIMTPVNLDLSESQSIWSRAEDFWHAVGWAFNCSVLHHERWEHWRIWLEFMCEVLESDWNERYRQWIEDKESSADSKVPSASRRRNSNRTNDAADQILKNSLILRYIEGASATYGRNRRIVRSIFADGGVTSSNEFREVFENELKQSKHKKHSSNSKKRSAQVNIDAEEFGDYLTDDEDDDEDEDSIDAADTTTTNDNDDYVVARTLQARARGRGRGRGGAGVAGSSKQDSAGLALRQSKRPRRGTRPQSTWPEPTIFTTPANLMTPENYGNSTGTFKYSDPSSKRYVPDDQIPPEHLATMHADPCTLGGMRSLTLRQRLLHLLSTVSQTIPEHFTPLEELYHLFAENIRHLPLPSYQAFISPTALPHFTSAALTTLCEYLLFRMRESAAPDTEDEYLSQAKLEHCFLPYGANTNSPADNAKISITLETLVILLAENDMLTVTPALKKAVTQGVMAREQRPIHDGRKKKKEADLHAGDIEWAWLLESGRRLHFLVEEIIPLTSLALEDEKDEKTG